MIPQQAKAVAPTPATSMILRDMETSTTRPNSDGQIGMASPAPLTMHSVRQWRAGLDDNATRLERWWLDHVLLPLLRLSRKRFRIPAPARMTLREDGTTTFEWFEDQGLYSNKDVARSKCQTERWKVKTQTVDEDLPEGSVKCLETEYPLSDLPKRFADAPMHLIVVSQNSVNEVLRQAKKLTKAISA